MSEKVLIRKATIDDAEGKGYVHYQSWIETYTGLFPEDKMNNLSLDRSIKTAREHPENTYVAIVDNNIVGFAAYMESRDEDLKDTGEIVAIYILKRYQGLGIGRKLVNACLLELAHFTKISLWVLSSNKKAIGFYKNVGFKEDGKKKLIYEKDVIRMIKQLS